MHIGRGMEEGKTYCSSREEARGLNISIGNQEIESDGNRERERERERERIDSEELVESMRSIRMEVQSCEEDNERLIRA